MSFVLLYLALWASPASSFQMRFLVPITPLLGVLTAEAYDHLALFLHNILASCSRMVLHGSTAFLLILNLPPFTSVHEVDRKRWDGWLTHVIHYVPIGVVIGRESQEDYLVKAVPSFAAWRYINANLPDNARVLTFSGGDNFYSKRERIWSDATVARPAVWGASCGQEWQALLAMRKLGISHVLFDKYQLDSLEPGTLAIAQPSAITSWYNREYEDRQFVLYRLCWERITSQHEDYKIEDWQ